MLRGARDRWRWLCCRGLRKVCGRALAKMRGLAGKEAEASSGATLWPERSRAGEEAAGVAVGAAACGHEALQPTAHAGGQGENRARRVVGAAMR